MSRTVLFVEIIKKLFPSRFSFARLTRNALVGKVIDKMLFNGDDIIYLPIDASIQNTHGIEDLEDVVLPSQVVEHFIAQSNYHWMMNFCICREASSCEEYPSSLGCLFLGEAVTRINPKFGKLVTQEEAFDHVRKCREIGLVHMVGRNKLDTVWLGAGPSTKLFTICNCCPCCCLWRMLPDVNLDIGRKVTKMPGVEVTVTDQCLGCGTCTQDICFVDAIYLDNGHAVIDQSCRGCGRCVEICPEQAIELSIQDNSFFDNVIDRLSPLVDLK